MPKLILPKSDLKRLIRERREMGGDRYDEVWNGVYVMSPLPDNEHQEIGGELTHTLKQAVVAGGGRVRAFAGCNVTDNAENWTKNYRCPDVAIYLPGNPAEDRQTHWLGGPDFAVEIVSEGDHTRKKLAFYAKVGVRELLVIDRKPWSLRLHRHSGKSWTLVGSSTLDHPLVLESEVLALTLRLLPGEYRPVIEVTRPQDGQRWIA